MRRILMIAAWIAIVATTSAPAAEPPGEINYQGVLRDAEGNPLDDSYDMVFRFYDDETAGNEILIDRHTAGDSQQVTVTKGLFNVALGSGAVSDGTGSGSYTSLGQLFRDHHEVWLLIEVESEALDPRVKVISAAYALNADHLDGKDSTHFVDTSSVAQAKTASLSLQPAGGADVLLANGNWGVHATSADGSYFEDADQSGQAYLANGNWGVVGIGNVAGGSFTDANSTGVAKLGYGDYGIEAKGDANAGYFENTYNDPGTHASIATQDYGIRAYGLLAGATLDDLNGSGAAKLAAGDTGIEASGSYTGGYFTDGTGYAFVGHDGTGILARGTLWAGEFESTDQTTKAHLADASYGSGITAWGDVAGGVFYDTDGTSSANVAVGSLGIEAFGKIAGGRFRDTDTSVAIDVAKDTYKLKGTGTVSFVQNHPDDPDRVLVYHAPEASEVAVYTRGSAQLENGVASVKLDPTFEWTANPDLGLTAHLTPRGTSCALHVAAISSDTLNVGVDDPVCSDVAFDYMVWGLRIGFEQLNPVQPKEQDAPIPSMNTHRERIAAEPELASYTALERFRNMTARLEGLAPEQIDLSRAAGLVERIHEFDPVTDGVERPTTHAQGGTRPQRAPSTDSPAETPEEEGGVPAVRKTSFRAPGDVASTTAIGPPPRERKTMQETLGSPEHRMSARIGANREDHDRQAQASTDSSALTVFPVTEAIDVGDLLTLDPERPGFLRRVSSVADPAVFGIAATEAKVREGEPRVELVESRYAVVKADASYGMIVPGDLLVASPTPGHAMRAVAPLPGTIVAKAAEPLQEGTGLIKVLVMLR